MKAFVIAAVLAIAARADASPPRWLDTFAALLRYEVAVAHDVDQGTSPVRFRDLGLAGAHVLGFVGKRHLVYQFGLDLSAGATTSAAG